MTKEVKYSFFEHMQTERPEIAVLTGDLIASTTLSTDQQQAAMACLEETAQQIANWPNCRVSFAVRGGDGWQMALSPAPLGLRAALMLRAALRALGKSHDSRIAIAAGTDDWPQDDNPNTSRGPVYVTSGRQLEAMKGDSTLHWGGGALGAATVLADHIVQSWTVAQARSLCLQLPPHAPKRADIAATLGVSRQSVNKALWAAGYPTLSEALQMIETLPLVKQAEHAERADD
ncbi:hypothetical protein [Thalassobius sp. Cn5-15]|uniref:hypothetical protein n=1 Tax=Thalassobius sp. Cn5-15 TaxID=2917763 RepID=UPI001EF34722|nr:hypothetical protein [Thalassobius sp. Cn5-15]MCG7492000.1 hypothetical protein [Thalassobius sp. Cn5-15]